MRTWQKEVTIAGDTVKARPSLRAAFWALASHESRKAHGENVRTGRLRVIDVRTEAATRQRARSTLGYLAISPIIGFGRSSEQAGCRSLVPGASDGWCWRRSEPHASSRWWPVPWPITQLKPSAPGEPLHERARNDRPSLGRGRWQGHVVFLSSA